MKVYLDTGVFFDYLMDKSLTARTVRKQSRRGRSRSKLYRDAVTCLSRLQNSHEPITSTLTLYELEDAIFDELSRIHKRTSYKDKFIVPSARIAVTQGLTVCDIYGIAVIDLRLQLIQAASGQVDLLRKGIRAADALHIVTAIHEDAELVISGDSHLIDLDGKLLNRTGHTIRFADTDTAIQIL